jgi:hypothetical protein
MFINKYIILFVNNHINRNSKFQIIILRVIELKKSVYLFISKKNIIIKTSREELNFIQ